MGEEDGLKSSGGKSIEPPKKVPTEKFGRAAAKGLAGLIPGGSILAEGLEAFVPSPEAEDRERWEVEITDGVNALNEHLSTSGESSDSTSVTLTGVSAHVAKVLTENCTDGLAHGYFSIEEIREKLGPEANLPSYDEVEDALGELESYGLVEPGLGLSNPSYSLAAHAYVALDPVIMGWSPADDAKVLAGFVVKNKDGVNVTEINEKIGWSKRRLNPALRIVLQFIDPRRVSNKLQPNFVTNFFIMNASERAALRRFASD